MGKTKQRRWKPAKHCEVVRSSGCLVVRWQESDTRWNWAELQSDILLLIFEKLGVIDVLTTARLVCRNWNKLTLSEHMLWRKIDMTGHDFSLSERTLERIAMIAIDKSEGTLEEFYADGLVTDDLLQYIATRTNSLKRLGLFLCPDISMEGLMAMAQRLWTKALRSLRLIRCLNVYGDHSFDNFADIIKMLPMLVELEVTLDIESYTPDLCKFIGPVCQQLKYFRFNDIWYSNRRDFDQISAMDDTGAQYIGKNMHQLRSLHLIGNRMTNRGLEAILEGCPHLEFLDIRHCFNLVLDENIMTKLSSIRNLKFPDDSADDYMKSISGDYYYDYYSYKRTCSCCFSVSSNPEEDYDDFYYETVPTLDEIYGDVMFLY